jgi:hypothetical protein
MNPSTTNTPYQPTKKRKRQRKKKNKFYYPIYSGYSFLKHPPIFEHQAHAAAWMISRFMKDGLTNVWGEDNYPHFLKYVGTIITTRKIISRGNNLLVVNNIQP